MKIIEKLLARCQDAFANPTPLIVTLGDSVTHGCFEISVNSKGGIDSPCRPADAYPMKLQARLNSYFPTANVGLLNAGIGGDNAVNGLARLERDVLCHKPDLVTVNFGLNDCGGGLDKLPAYEKAMDEIFERVLASGAECILVTPNRMCSYVSSAFTDPTIKPLAESIANSQNTGLLDAYIDAARACAKKRGVPVADALKVWNALEKSGVDTTAMLINGLNHPTAAAHDIFVEEIFRVLMEY